MYFLRIVGEFVLQVFITTIVVYFLFTWWEAIPAFDANKTSDPVSLANTFMVFVTFIVVIATVAVSIGAVVYTKQYSQAKERMLSENLDEVIKGLSEKQDIRIQFIDQMLNYPTIKESIDEKLESLNSSVNEQLTNIENRLDRFPSEISDLIRREIEAYDARVRVDREGREEDNELIEDFNQLN